MQESPVFLEQSGRREKQNCNSRGSIPKLRIRQVSLSSRGCEILIICRIMSLGLFEILLNLSILLIGISYYLTTQNRFWKKRGIAGPAPSFLLGNYWDVILGRKGVHDLLEYWYKTYENERCVGIFKGMTPELLVRDLDLIKSVYVRDFQVIQMRNPPSDRNDRVDPLTVHIGNLGGREWRQVRAKLSPAFTSGKLKKMFGLMSECTNNLERYIRDNLTKTGGEIECRELAAKYTTDSFGSCAFGIDMNAFGQEDNRFRQIGKRLFAPNDLVLVRMLIREYFPGLYSFFNVRFIPTDITEFFIDSIAKTIDYRIKNNFTRHDFIDQLVFIRQNTEDLDFEPTDSFLAAQAFVFFAAGFETSASSICSSLYELALAEDIQEKARQEMTQVTKLHEGDVTYEAISEMKYLHMIVQETLRKHPPFPSNKRITTREWKIPGTDCSVPRGVKIVIPIRYIHHDPRYFPDPEKYDPERFTEEGISSRPPLAFQPFGDGPRNCIGARFANYQIKLALVKILMNFRVTTCAKTPVPLIISKNSFTLTPIGDVVLKFEAL